MLGVDLAERLLERARAKAAARKLPQVEFRLGDMLDLRLPPDHFDAVVCVFGIFFVPDMSAAVRALWQVTRPGRAARDHDLGPALPGTRDDRLLGCDPRREARSLQGLQSLGSHLGSSGSARAPARVRHRGRRSRRTARDACDPHRRRLVVGRSGHGLSRDTRATRRRLARARTRCQLRLHRQIGDPRGRGQRRLRRRDEGHDPADARTTSLRFRARATGTPAAPGSVRCARSRRSGR